MSKGARTVLDLEKEVALLRTRDSARAREIRAVRAEMDSIERMLADERETLLRLISDSPLPASNSTPLTPIRGANAGTALGRVRSFFLRLLGK